MSISKPQHKPLLPNPFHLSDSEIIEKVYLSHTYDDQLCNKETLFKLVYNVIALSTRLAAKIDPRNGFIESKGISGSFEPEFSTLKLMSWQMITYVSGVENVHQTTLRILQQVRSFSWDAKALIALAAFSLEYGNFWNLYQASDHLGNSLKVLNQIQKRLQVPVIDLSVTTTVKIVLEAVEKIKLWGTWSADERYDTDEVPALSDALQHIPLVVYWAVASLVACNSNIQCVSDYPLKDFSAKLALALQELSKHLLICELQIANISDFSYLIFKRGIDAFPFRKQDGYLLAHKWKWFWDEIRKTNLQHIQVKGDRYIFIYGGSDKWTQKFTLAVDRIKRHPTMKSADAIIDYYHLGKDDPKIVPRFWIGIESKRQKKHYDKLDCQIQEIVKSLLCLKQDIQGWAILTKGSNVKILGYAQPMYQTVAEFDLWKDKVLVKEGFDIAFQEYYELKRKELPAPQPCAFMNIDNYASNNVLATITCPNPSCGRVMEVTSVNYKCCHGNFSDNAN